MQQTYSTRLTLNDDEAELFEELGLWYGRLKHVLYRLVAVHGGKCKDYKNAFIEKHQITARQFNAMAIEVQGIIDGTTVLLEARQKALKDTIKSKKASVRRATAQEKEVAKRKRALSPKKQAALSSRIYHLPLQIARLEKKLTEVKERLAAKAPGICFGSRKLFNAQFHLKESGFASFEEWKAAWRKARSHQFFFVGSKGETGGNQTCTVSVVGLGARKGKVRFSARIRLPDSMVGGEGKYAHVGFELGYGAAQVCASLVQGIALSYRFHREESGSWLVLISTDVKEAPKISREVGYGVLVCRAGGLPRRGHYRREWTSTRTTWQSQR